MESNEETTQGDHPQVPPAKPPDQSATQPDGASVSETHVLNEAMSEDTSEEETPTINALEQQPSAAAKNRVSLPIKSASDPGGDHAGAADGCPGVISRDHMGTADCGPEETVPPETSNQGTGKTLKSRSLNKQEAKVSKRHFDKRMNELINATRDLAQEQHMGSMTDQGQNSTVQENEEPKVTEDDVTPEEAGDEFNDRRKEKEKQN